MRLPLTADSSAAGPAAPRRRGATAIEYCVMLSFMIVVMVLVIQHIGALVAPNFNRANLSKNAATTVNTGGSSGGGSGP